MASGAAMNKTLEQNAFIAQEWRWVSRKRRQMVQ